MSLPYFPMFPSDFNADTGHLTLAEDGAYNRLLRLQWCCPSCKMPADMEWIFRKARAVTETDQAIIAAIVAEFFTRKGGKIFNARLLKEYVKSDVAHSKRVSSGSKGGSAKALKSKQKDNSNAIAMLKQPEPEPEPEPIREEGGDGRALGEISTFRERILREMGVDQISGLTGRGGKMLGTQADMAEAGRWLELPGITEDVACAEVRRIMSGKRDGPPASFAYFQGAMCRLSAALTAPKLSPIQIEGQKNEHGSHGNPRPSRPGDGRGTFDAFAAVAARYAGPTQ